MSGILKHKVGVLRPSQMLFSFGVGAMVDLPKLSVMVMGLDDWLIKEDQIIKEERLKQAVRHMLPSVKYLASPPIVTDERIGNPHLDAPQSGVPVAPFPGWFVCSACRILLPIYSPLLEPKGDGEYYTHNCGKGGSHRAIPARFVLACERGHLDDFPWDYFVHKKAGRKADCKGDQLSLTDFGVSGEAADVFVHCDFCDVQLPMSEAFGKEGREMISGCTARRPHLRDYQDNCDQQMRTTVLGASNSWFAASLALLHVPAKENPLRKSVNDFWQLLSSATQQIIIGFLRQTNEKFDTEFASYTDEEVWAAVEQKRNQQSESETSGPAPNLKLPEWRAFTNPSDPNNSDEDFQIEEELPLPGGYEGLLERVVLVHRLREVRALIGFTRIEPPGEDDSTEEEEKKHRAALSRKDPTWVPAAEVRGEGIFIQFKEQAIQDWLNSPAVESYSESFYKAHMQWRSEHKYPNPKVGFPTMRYVLLHSLAHALMRQLALECGYNAASIRERIYSLPASDKEGNSIDGGPMAGVLIYTSANDSEGTLGGLVRLGSRQNLERQLKQALVQMRLCASDPLCAEHTLPHPPDDRTLHGAACHACLFAPETSCERGNKYLDRTVLVNTVQNKSVLPFFGNVQGW